LSHSDGYK